MSDELREKLIATIPIAGQCIERNCIDKKEPGPGNVRCYWHKLAKTTMDNQKRVANERRQSSKETRRTIPANEWPPGYRYCSSCLSMVPKWYCTAARCKPCTSMGQQRSTFNITQAQQEALLNIQDGHCAVCGCSQRTKSLALDHRHMDNTVRGFLDGQGGYSCNEVTGMWFDDPARFVNMACYLLDAPARRVGIDGPPMSNVELEKRIIELVRDYRFRLGYTS